ncbi:hypothetical protein TRAPUB_6459 [Trametes pubescens]|uniref:Uncharacterized protein n=1 Tax=Trametes pubescens TaxID=154538 RepID=A0A1M2V5S1_TRAPU|nr:hypothetical protein TRAPUB_6459 [Trametes pubescens]
MKNWVSNSSGVESNGVPGMVGSTWSAAAIVCLQGMLCERASHARGSRGDIRGEESDDLVRAELAGVVEAREDLADVVERLGHRQVGCGLCRVLATEEHVQAGRARAVAHADRAGELDTAFGGNVQVGGTEVVAGDDRRLRVDDLVDTVVGVEVRLDAREDSNRAVRAASAEYALLLGLARDADGVVEGETKGLMDVLAALAAVEQIRLDVIDDREERAARRVRGDLASGARHFLGGGTWREKQLMLAAAVNEFHWGCRTVSDLKGREERDEGSQEFECHCLRL